MDQLLPLAHEAAARLIARGETVALAESSAGGLISASLLAVPGASAYFKGAVNLYTAEARQALLGLDPRVRSATVDYAALIAGAVQNALHATWGIGESGVTGPHENRYGDPVGHAAIAVAGPHPHIRIVRTRQLDRAINMRAFAAAALQLLIDQLNEVT